MSHTPSKLSPFNFKILQRLNEAEVENASILVAVSGGRDSVSLLSSLKSLAPRLGLKLAVVHLHHGPTSRAVIQDARNRARSFVRSICLENSIPFSTIEADRELKSEASLRDFRRGALAQEAAAGEYDFVAFGHHAGDLFETQILRLIRGTSAKGLRAMAFTSFDAKLQTRLLRPFLFASSEEIASFASREELTWIDDPTNSETQYLRNWIRHEWLPLLERKQPGSATAFARSLAQISGDALRERAEFQAEKFQLDRSEFCALETVGKRNQLANYIGQFEIKNFSTSRLDEVLKRLASLERKGQRRASFSVGGLSWEITPDTIRAQRPQS